MAGPWFSAEPADAEFLEAAPFRMRGVLHVPRPAAEVWGELTADGALWWCRILDDVDWTSSRPFGVGTTRTVTSLRGASVLRERFFRWEEGRRKSFYVEQSNGPLFRRFAEDYLIEPEPGNACRFTWTIAADPRLPLANPVNRLLLRTLFDDTARHYGLRRV